MAITDVNALLDAISQVNLDFFPLPLVFTLHLIAFLVLMFMFFSPQSFTKLVNVVVKVWLGISLLILVAFILAVARAFSGIGAAIFRSAGVVYAGIAILVLADIWRQNLDFSLESRGLRQWAGLVVALCGISIYLLIQLLLGLRYPRMVFYGAEVPTVTYLIALFGAARPITSKLYRLILALLSTEGFFIGIWAITSQVWFDAVYGLAGLFGLAVLGLWITADRGPLLKTIAH
jgi:hypothetical protein